MAMADIQKIKIVLQALADGHMVRIGDIDYQQHPEAEGLYVCQVLRAYGPHDRAGDPKGGRPVYLGGDDLTFNTLVADIAAMPDDQIAVLAANRALNLSRSANRKGLEEDDVLGPR